MRQYYRDDSDYNIVHSESFKFKINITEKPLSSGKSKCVKKAVSLKYLSNFWRPLEMTLNNCKINLILTWSENCVIYTTTGETKSEMTEKKLCVPVVSSSTQNNAKLLEKLKSGF